MANLFVIKEVNITNGTTEVVFANGVNGVIFDNTFDKYLFEASGIITNSAASTVQIFCQVSITSGASWLSGASDYRYKWYKIRGAASQTNTVGSFSIVSGETAPTSYPVQFKMNFYTPYNSYNKYYNSFDWLQDFDLSPGNTAMNMISTRILTNSPVNGIRFYPDLSTFKEGRIVMYGLMDKETC